MNSLTNFNIVAVQYKPNHKNVSENISFLTQLMSKYKKEDKIDLVLFPELALSGSTFQNVEDIEPCLSEYNKGEQFEFASNLAKRLDCYVFMGFPEKAEDGKLWNSLMIVNNKGISLPPYRKKNLYNEDKNWASEAEDFTTFGYIEIMSHEKKLVKIGYCICFDLCQYQLQSPFENFEFANFCKSKDVDLIAYPTNWMDFGNYEDRSEEANTRAIKYWFKRLEPFTKSDIQKNVYFVAANILGFEIHEFFIGGSCVLQLCPKAEILTHLDKVTQDTIFYSLKV